MSASHIASDLPAAATATWLLIPLRPLAERNRQPEAERRQTEPKLTYAHNVDLWGKHYLHHVAVSQGVFYKMLYNYIASSLTTVQFTAPGTAAPAPFLETARLNTGAAHLIGAEASWEQHLTMLPGALGGAGSRANYSYNTSVVGIPGHSDHSSLQRTARRITITSTPLRTAMDCRPAWE